MKYILIILSSCLFLLAQTVNGQTQTELSVSDNFEIAFAHYGLPPSHISTLDFCELEVRNKNGGYPTNALRWYGDFHAMQEYPYLYTVKGHFLKTGTCTVYAELYSGVISRTFQISDPYLTSTSTILVYGKEETVEILNLPREEVSITWHVSEGLKIVSGQGTTKVVYTTNEKTSSYEFISASVQSEVWVVSSRNNVSIIGAPRSNESQLSRTSSNSFILNVDQETISSSLLKYELYDQARGSLMRKGVVESKAGVLNFDNVPKGIYVLKLYLDEKNIQTRKILIN